MCSPCVNGEENAVEEASRSSREKAWKSEMVTCQVNDGSRGERGGGGGESVVNRGRRGKRDN